MRPILSGQFIYQLSVSMRKCYMEKKKKKRLSGTLQEKEVQLLCLQCLCDAGHGTAPCSAQ